MKCKKCGGVLEIFRICRRIRMQCSACRKQYHIHEIADRLDPETEELLERYTAIIYD